MTIRLAEKVFGIRHDDPELDLVGNSMRTLRRWSDDFDDVPEVRTLRSGADLEAEAKAVDRQQIRDMADRIWSDF